MKTFSYPALATVCAVLSLMAWTNAQNPAPTPLPAGSPPASGTSVVGAIGLTVFNNAIYLVRDSGVIRVDAATIPSGYMLTLDGRILPLPPGINFQQPMPPSSVTLGPGGLVQSR